jgi:hypothetical protein
MNRFNCDLKSWLSVVGVLLALSTSDAAVDAVAVAVSKTVRPVRVTDAKPRHAVLILSDDQVAEVPNASDLSGANQQTQRMYGIGNDPIDAFCRNCLPVRQIVEKGVRFLQLYNGSWHSHDYIDCAHGNLIRGIDQPIAALIRDLKQRSLLDRTYKQLSQFSGKVIEDLIA